MRSSKHLAITLLFIFCVSIIFPSAASAQETTRSTLGLQEAIDIAYKKSPDIRLADLSVDKAQIQLDKSAESITWIPTGGMVYPAYQQVVNTYQQAGIALNSAKRTQQATKDSICKDVISAYCTAVKNYNSMENARLSLEDLQKQKTVSSLAKVVGLTSDYDYSKMASNIKQAEESYNAAKSTYDGSISALGVLVGESQGWQPELTSRAVLSKYERNSLDIEISRGTSESTLVWTKEALLAIEESKQTWILPNSSTDLKDISLSEAEINYEQAKLSARTSIEQLYYGIDALEGQIEVAGLAYQNAQNDLKNCQLKYDLGIIAQRSLAAGGESLASVQLAEQKARTNLENARIELANQKAQFAYLTGQTVYDAKDWAANTQQAITAKSAEFRISSNSYNINGVANTMDVAPYIKASRTYVPLRYLGLALGVAEDDIVWDAAAQTATLSLGSTKVVFTIGSTTYTVNGAAKTMDVAPEITNGRTMLPARYAAEGLGYTAGWDPATQTVSVSK